MLSFFPRGVYDEILNLIESVSEGFPSYSSIHTLLNQGAVMGYKGFDSYLLLLTKGGNNHNRPAKI